MTQTWETVTEIENEDFRLSFLASGGTAWDAPQENHYFYPSGERRVYHIIIRYYSGAEEGHGYRFRTMLETFSVIDPTAIIQPQVNTVTKSTDLDLAWLEENHGNAQKLEIEYLPLTEENIFIVIS